MTLCYFLLICYMINKCCGKISRFEIRRTLTVVYIYVIRKGFIARKIKILAVICSIFEKKIWKLKLVILDSNKKLLFFVVGYLVQAKIMVKRISYELKGFGVICVFKTLHTLWFSRIESICFLSKMSIMLCPWNFQKFCIICR